MEIRPNLAQAQLNLATSYSSSLRPVSKETTDKIKPVQGQKQEPLDLNKKINEIVKQDLKEIQDPDKMDKKQLEELIKELQAEIEFLKNRITFKVEPKYDNSWLVQVINKESEEVLRQFPPEYLLKISKSMKEMIKGILVDEKT